MTLEDHLAAGYRYQMRPHGVDPALACAADVSRAELAAEAERLESVMAARSVGSMGGCHITRTRLDYIRRVLDLAERLSP